jgi:hypothetical protein
LYTIDELVQADGGLPRMSSCDLNKKFLYFCDAFYYIIMIIIGEAGDWGSNGWILRAIACKE